MSSITVYFFGNSKLLLHEPLNMGFFDFTVPSPSIDISNHCFMR